MWCFAWNFLAFFAVVFAHGNLAPNQGCIHRTFGFGSFVCVCNVTYCDSLTPVSKPEDGTIRKITSNKAEKRWFGETSEFQNLQPQYFSNNFGLVITIDRRERFQKIWGFGGAFTDSSGINIRSVPKTLQDHILKGYFTTEGLEYNTGRVPIAGTDFSTHPYSYDDLSPGQTDPMLENFDLVQEDYLFKIPYVKKALNLSLDRGVKLKLFASPWSGPGWMKDNGQINGNGKLKREFYSTWASYIIRFLEAYKDHGISFVAMTTQNEPTAGLLFNYSFNEMAWWPENQGVWIAQNLGPQLKGSGFDEISLFILDDQRFLLPAWPLKVMSVANVSQFVGGIGVHWYWDFMAPPHLLDLTHTALPDLPIIYTEACTGSKFWEFFKVKPGSWERGESYAKSIIETLQHWVVGWTDWNLALDLQGGPNWANNFVDSVILVDKEKQEIYRQPMYYSLAHFSKVIPEGSQRIGFNVSGNANNIHAVAFIRPDNATAVMVLNLNNDHVSVEFHDGERTHLGSLDPRSITSFIWV